MSGDTTIQALKRLTYLPERSDDLNGDLIAGQNYWDVWFTGGFMSNITLSDVTINGVSYERTERVITDPGDVTVLPDDYVITVKKDVPEATTITLPASPTLSRSLIIKDGGFDAGTFNITIDGNGKNIDEGTEYVISISGGTVEIIYNGTEWNIINTYKDTSGGGGIVTPGTTTNSAIVLWDGTSGTAIKNSAATIDDFGNIAANNLSGTNTGDQTITLTGVVTGSGTQSFATTFASAGLNSLSGLSVGADEMLFTTAPDTYESLSVPSYSRGLLGNTDQAGWQAALGIATSSIRSADTVGGTATNVALTFSPPIGTLQDKQLIIYRPSSSSVANMNIACDGGSNISLRKLNGAATAIGDFFANDPVMAQYNLSLNRWYIVSNINHFLYAVIASASSIALPSGVTFANITGTTGITGISNIFDGQTVIFRHSATLTYTAGGTFLLPYSAATLTVNSGDMVVIYRDGSGFTRVADVYRATQAVARADLGFIEPFESAEITYASGSGNYSIAHGLGAIPRFAQMVLRCKTAEHGYSVGVEVLPSINGTTSNFINIVKSSTNVTALQTGNFPMVDANTLVAVTPTPANWRVVFYASR